jgi:fructose-1,6-bisphosphatase/inositol monophosphatase family enzyme
MVGVERLLQHGCHATRSLGSGVLDICYIATGRLDVVFAGVANEGGNHGIIGEASVIAVKADASIEALLFGNEGEQLDLYDKSVICAGNQELLDECRRVAIKS